MRTLMVLLALSAPALAKPRGEALRFSQHGFSLRALETPPVNDTLRVVTMLMQERDGFAPNVNVLLQPFAGSVEQYLEVSLAEFKQRGLTLVTSKRLDADTVLLEYTGVMGGVSLHWYARAARGRGRPTFYLVTGTATAAQWEDGTTAAALRACVDSFKVD